MLLSLAFLAFGLAFAKAVTTYNVGIGIADNTGPAAEIGMVSVCTFKGMFFVNTDHLMNFPPKVKS